MIGAIICLWAPPEHRLDAFVAGLSALTYTRAACYFRRQTLRMGSGVRNCTIAEAISAARDLYGAGAEIKTLVDVTLDTLRVVSTDLCVFDDAFARAFHQDYEPFTVDVHDSLLPCETQDLLRRVCVSPHVLTCASSVARTWPAPVEASATYHADGQVVRDLALTWLHLYDAHRVRDIAGQSLDALRARVEAAPPDASVGVATSLATWSAHWTAGWDDAERSHDKRQRRRDAIRAGPRARLSGDVDLTREQVLAALATPPAALLEALEAAAAAPDDEWRAAEPFARDAMQATEEGVPTYDVDVTTRKHVQFLQQNVPHHVRRLPNGGVMLATHPDRVLWPLWADALSLLGIAP